LNVAGGLKVSEPAADLAVAAALLSSFSGEPVPGGSVFFGEVGLSGEIRQVSHAEGRLKEAAKLGFERAYTPKRRGKTPKAGALGLNTNEIGHLAELAQMFDSES